MHTGEAKTAGGRAGEGTTAEHSAAASRGCGFELARFKTGTPLPAQRPHDRLHASCELQPGDADPQPFSLPDRPDRRSRSSTATSPTPTTAVHELIRANLHRAPMYSRPDPERAGRATARRSRTRSCASPTRTRTRSSSSRKGRNTLRVLLQRHLHQPAARRAGRDAPADPRPGARRDHALRLRGRVRLRPARRSLHADAGNEARRRACTSPARSTARPATRRPPPRG